METDTNFTPNYKLDPDEVIIDTKSFFHNNLILLLIHNTTFNLYYTLIHRVNEGNNYNLHGMSLKLQDARAIFERIRL